MPPENQDNTISPALTPDLSPASPPPPKFSLRVIIIPVLIIVFLLSGLGVSAFFIATDIIPIPNETLKITITAAVNQLPFVPKTPKYVLQSAAKAHEKLQKNTFDLSIASSTNSFQSYLGGSGLDTRVTGFLDYSKPNEPHFSLRALLNKDLSLEANKPGSKIYVKLNKIPFFFESMLSTGSARLRPVFENWIAVDTAPLETKVHGLVTTKVINLITQKSVVPLLKMSQEKLDGIPCYKIEYEPNPEQLNALVKNVLTELDSGSPNSTKTKISDNVKGFRLTVWIREKDYYVTRVESTVTVNQNQLPKMAVFPSGLITDNTPVSLAIVLKLNNFGESMSVPQPQSSISPEQFWSMLISN